MIAVFPNLDTAPTKRKPSVNMVELTAAEARQLRQALYRKP